MVETASRSLRGRYENILWQTMEILGITESIERKVVTAVVIQFAVTVGIFALPFVLSGTFGQLLSGLLFLGAIIALGNTLLIVRRDFTEPILDLEEKANAISKGTVETELRRTDQLDEVGSLRDAFADMQDYLGTVSRQADALARQDFEDQVVTDAPVPVLTVNVSE